MKEDGADSNGNLGDDTIPVSDQEISAEAIADDDSASEELSPAEGSLSVDPTNLESVARDNSQTESIQSLTRLLVGGGLVGWEELQAQMQTWEAETSASLPKEEDDSGIIYYTREEVTLRQPRSQAPLSNQQVQAERPETSADILRYALIGLLFDSQSRLGRRSAKIVSDVSHVANRTAGAFLTPVLNQVGKNPVMQPTRRRFERVVQRGETIAARWVRRGRMEEARSRVMVRTAVQGSFNTSMDQLGQAPALQQLVRKQSAGLTQDALDEVRGRVVTGDLLAESLARRLVRRGPQNAPTAPSIVDQAGESEGPG
jgi:hypothetical protein